MEIINNLFNDKSDEELIYFIYKNIIDYDIEYIFPDKFNKDILDKWGKIINILITDDIRLPECIYQLNNFNITTIKKEFKFFHDIMKVNQKYILQEIRNEYNMICLT